MNQISNNSQNNQPAPKRNGLSFLAGIPGNVKLIGIVVILILLIFAFPIICQFSGKTLGSAVGVAVGTYKAVTEEIPQAYTEGKDTGLSAEDTTVKIAEKAKEIGKLDVLVADMSIANNHKVGDKYQALYSMQAKVVFSVDVTEAIVTMNTNEKVVGVALPPITPDVYIDDTSTERVAEWSKGLYKGKATDGFTEYMNSRKKSEEEIIPKLNYYDRLLDRAEITAKEQVSQLIQSIVGSDYAVIVNVQ